MEHNLGIFQVSPAYRSKIIFTVER